MKYLNLYNKIIKLAQDYDKSAGKGIANFDHNTYKESAFDNKILYSLFKSINFLKTIFDKLKLNNQYNSNLNKMLNKLYVTVDRLSPKQVAIQKAEVIEIIKEISQAANNILKIINEDNMLFASNVGPEIVHNYGAIIGILNRISKIHNNSFEYISEISPKPDMKNI